MSPPDLPPPVTMATEESNMTAVPDPFIVLKISAKKDSTEAMIKSLISRTHAQKPTSYTLKHTEANTECFLKYPSREIADEVHTKISGEKVNSAAFESEVIEVDKASDSEGEEDSNLAQDPCSQAGLISKEMSAEALKSIAEMLKQNPRRMRKHVSLNISPRNKQRRHQRMKTGSKHMRKQKKHSTSSDSNSAPASDDDLNLDENLLKKVKTILAKEPIAAASTTTASKGNAFDPYTGLPSKPTKVNKVRAKNLKKTIHISTSDEEQNSGVDKVTALLNILMKTNSGIQKKQRKKSKKKRRNYSSESTDSSTSSSTETSSTSSSSDESPTKMRRKLKKLQKKGKLKSGRHRKGLAVIRNEMWPHDGINARLAGKTFQTVESLTQMAFVGGILNPLLDSEDFKRLEKKKLVPKLRQKLKVLNELIHGIIRSQNFPEVRDFYLSTLEELETGQGSWKDQEYWNTQMLLFRTVLRSAPSYQLPPARRRSTDLSSGPQPRDCCHQFNNDGCPKESPHPNNDPSRSPETVNHFCKICLRRNLKKVHAAKACKAGISAK